MLHGCSLVRQLTRHVLVVNRYHRRGLLTLAIETSCDDTCVAILEKKSSLDRPASNNLLDKRFDTTAKLHFHEKITAKNTGLGGIHPVEALNSHRANLSDLITKSLNYLPDAVQDDDPRSRPLFMADGRVKQKPDFVSVTRGPGMRSNLSCGLETAKGLSIGWQVPLLGVHHMQAHALTPRLVHATNNASSSNTPEFPFLTLLVSGGHTMLVHSTDLTSHDILATTADVAIGDCLDKSGRIVLPEEIKANTKDTAYGKYLSQYAFTTAEEFGSWPVPKRRQDEIGKQANQFGWAMQIPFSDTRKMAFSFTGIATQVERFFEKSAAAGTISDEERRTLARSAMGTAFEHLGSRTVLALESLTEKRVEIQTLVVSGGVAANDFLRYFLRSMLDVRGFEHVRLVFPPVELCTDNAAMIAWAGMEMFEAGFRSELGIDALRKWSMDATSQDGGILGVDGWIRTT